MPGPVLIDGIPDFGILVSQIVEAFYDVNKVTRVQTAITNGVAEGGTIAQGAETGAKIDMIANAAAIKDLVERKFGWLAGWFLGWVVANTFDVPVNEGAFARLSAAGDRKGIARAVTEKMVAGLTGGNTSVEPSAQPAANYLSVV